MAEKRIKILVGHYGSGKTSLAASIALDLRSRGNRVAVADMDIVNPYFRTADCRALFDNKGIELIASPYAGSNVDLPALPKELYTLLADKETFRILDVGGDDRGAVALGRYVPEIKSSGYAMLFTVNFYRPLTRTAEEALSVLREIEAACGLAVTAIVNNSNIGPETAAKDVLSTVSEAERLGALSGLPVQFTSVDERLAPALAGKVPSLYAIRPLFPTG